MYEIIDSLKKVLFGSFSQNHTDIVTSRKRRLSRDIDNFQSKMRRLDDYPILRSSSPLYDLETPSTSKDVFKKPFFSSPKQSTKPTDILDLSDDDDQGKKCESALFNSNNDEWIDASKARSEFRYNSSFLNRKLSDARNRAILEKGKNTIMNCNNFASRLAARKPTSSVLNESIRINEKKRYKEILESLAKSNTRFFSIKELNGTEKCVKGKKNNEKRLSVIDLYKKRCEDIHGKTIDLTDDSSKPKTISIDSDSDSDIKFVSLKKHSPINSLKKRLEIEPVTNQKWITEWDNNYSRTTEEKKKQIEEEEMKRDKFRDVIKANANYQLEENLKSCLRLQEVILLDEEPEEELSLPELTEEQERRINFAFKSGPANHVFIDKFNLRITRSDIQTLRGLNWLNDEVINFYTNLISERGNGNNPKLPKVHSMNTFFYPKLLSQGYNSLRRWTKKVDIFAQDMIVVPIHLGVHWCLSIIDFRDKTIKYYDSMGSENPKCLKSLADYLKQEHLDKKKSDYDVSDWKLISVRDIPQQMNGSDCGMFACMYAEFLTRNAKILFTQEHMPYFRRKMVYEITTGQLLMK